MYEKTKGDFAERLTEDKISEIVNEPVKMAILDFIEKKGPCSFGDIIKELSISQPAGMNHILELKLTGLLERNTSPPNYDINRERYKKVKEYLKSKGEN